MAIVVFDERVGLEFAVMRQLVFHQIATMGDPAQTIQIAGNHRASTGEPQRQVALRAWPHIPGRAIGIRQGQMVI
jgi:hypothetical protein